MSGPVKERMKVWRVNSFSIFCVGNNFQKPKFKNQSCLRQKVCDGRLTFGGWVQQFAGLPVTCEAGLLVFEE
jgi:hypothetical protein